MKSKKYTTGGVRVNAGRPKLGSVRLRVSVAPSTFLKLRKLGDLIGTDACTSPIGIALDAIIDDIFHAAQIKLSGVSPVRELRDRKLTAAQFRLINNPTRSVGDVAKAMGVSKSMVYYYRRKFKM